MSENYTKVTHQSWFSRLKNSLMGTIFGLMLFLAAFVTLFWNEGRAVDTHKMLQEGAGVVLSVSSSRVDPANEGKLVHVSGKTATNDVLTDPIFDVKIKAIGLRRKVEMLQWVENKKTETRKKVGGGTESTTTYSYKKDWSEKLIDSNKFEYGKGHENPVAMIFESESWKAENVSLDAFKLSSRQIGGIGGEKKYKLTKDNRIKKQIAGKVRVEGGVLFIGSKKREKVGDFRIQMEVIYPGEISLIAAQAGNSFKPYSTEVGGAISMQTMGIRPATQMFDAAEAANTTLTWFMRFAGFMMMFTGLKMIVRILSVLADIIPLFGNIVGGGTSIVALLVALVLTLLTIAVAWVFYRPLVSGILVVVAIGAFVLARSKAKKETPVEEAESASFGR